MKHHTQLPIYYTDGTRFYRKYKGKRTYRDENNAWVELPQYEKPIYWEIPAADVYDPEFSDHE